MIHMFEERFVWGFAAAPQRNIPEAVPKVSQKKIKIRSQKLSVSDRIKIT